MITKSNKNIIFRTIVPVIILLCTSTNFSQSLNERYLNELEEFRQENPTTENVSKTIYENLNGKLPPEISVAKVRTWESENCAAAYYV